MILLNLPNECRRIRRPDEPLTISDHLETLYCVTALNGVGLSLRDARRSCESIGWNLGELAWDRAVEAFRLKGREVRR